MAFRWGLDAAWTSGAVVPATPGSAGPNCCPGRGDAGQLRDALLSAAPAYGGRPCGLGGRDTLRLALGYPLHGQDLRPDITPLRGRGLWSAGSPEPRCRCSPTPARWSGRSPAARSRRRGDSGDRPGPAGPVGWRGPAGAGMCGDGTPPWWSPDRCSYRRHWRSGPKNLQRLGGCPDMSRTGAMGAWQVRREAPAAHRDGLTPLGRLAHVRPLLSCSCPDSYAESAHPPAVRSTCRPRH